MKPDDLERQIERQPRRAIPPEWREGILAAARQAGRAPSRGGWASLWERLSALKPGLVSALWPSPRAWAGLAAIWLGVVAVQLGMREGAAPVARATAPPSRQLVLALAEQRRLMAELAGLPETAAATPARPAPPRPRSEAARRIVRA